VRAGRLLSFIVVAVLLPLIAPTAAQAAAAPTAPWKDPFYRYSGSQSLSVIAPGTILKHRSVHVALGANNATPVRAEQLLYRTTGQRGEATATVTTVLRSPTAKFLPRVVGYLSFYDGLGMQCSPSYSLAGGDTRDKAIQQQAQEEELLILWYLAHGDVVTVPDFEGTGMHWMAGRESGYATLDALRATKSFLGLGARTKVGLSGYSGGSVAANWAFESAPTYAPALHIVGVAMAGVPANYVNHIAYMNGTDEYSAAIPGELLGLARAYGVDLTPYLTPYGRNAVDRVRNACIVSMFGQFPRLTIDKLLQPAFRDIAHAEPFATMLREQTMGMANTHPRGAMFIAMGNADGRGDGAMVAADARALARRYCGKGVPVMYQQYRGLSHIEAAAAFEPQTGPFLQARFDGVPFPGKCQSIG
jgi:secretory lipase